MRTCLRSLVGLALFCTCVQLGAQSGQTPTILFVCEHGSAKSVIAAAHFNRMAETRGLPYRAVSRGIHPDAKIPGNIKAGLLADGLDVSNWTPKPVVDGDLRRAERVVTLSCELPKSKSVDASKTIDWRNVPAVSDGYQAARADIVERVDELLKTLLTTKLRQK